MHVGPLIIDAFDRRVTEVRGDRIDRTRVLTVGHAVAQTLPPPRSRLDLGRACLTCSCNSCTLLSTQRVVISHAW